MQKEAAIDWKSVANIFSGVAGKGVDLAKWLADHAIAAYGITLTGGALAGLAGGYLTAKATSPTSIVENSDKELEREALDTEIDVTERKLAALELRKRRRSNKTSVQQYDRFV